MLGMEGVASESSAGVRRGSLKAGYKLRRFLFDNS